MPHHATRHDREARLPSGELGALLRHWRNLRGKSQLDLSMEAGISQRHISFIESGRSTPSRQLLMDVADTLDVPLRERNALLLAAGYAPLYSDVAWDAPEMQSITVALRRMLRQHEPFPAVAMDRYWNVLEANEAAPRFFGAFVDMAARAAPRNMLHLIFDPAGMRPHVVGWTGVARALLERVRREAVGRVVDEPTKELIATLLAYPDAPSDDAASVGTGLPVIPLSFVHEGSVLNYFSMITTVGTPQTIAAQELRIESMFAADDATERLHLALMARRGRKP